MAVNFLQTAYLVLRAASILNDIWLVNKNLTVKIVLIRTKGNCIKPMVQQISGNGWPTRASNRLPKEMWSRLWETLQGYFTYNVTERFLICPRGTLTGKSWSFSNKIISKKKLYVCKKNFDGYTRWSTHPYSRFAMTKPFRCTNRDFNVALGSSMGLALLA